MGSERTGVALNKSIRFALILLAASVPNGESQAQDETAPVETITSAADPATNSYFWLRHTEGKQIGDVPPYTGFGSARILRLGNGVILLNAQGQVTNDAEGGGNFGITRRFFLGNAIVGGGLWYDLIQSPNQHTFQQIGISLELLLPSDLALRLNSYSPVGPDTDNLATTFGPPGVGGVIFQGNNIVTGQNVFFLNETALHGVDFELASGIGDFGAEGYLGYYNFQGENAGSTHGVKGGVRGYLTNSLAGDVTVSNDRLFGTNVFGSLTWFFGSGGNMPRRHEDRLTIPVERSSRVVTARTQTSTLRFIPLTNPRTNAPITVTHVNSSGLAGTGTFEDPNGSLTAANGSTFDIVYLHADSVFDGQSYALAQFQRVLGEANGIDHLVDTVELGVITLPRATMGAAAPIIRNSPGTAFVLSPAGNNEISGVVIDGPGLHGIAALTGAANININRLTIQNTGGDGIRITPATNVVIDNVTFINIGGTAVVLNANNVAVTNSTILGTGNHGISFGEGGNITGFAMIADTAINFSGAGSGILLNNAQNGAQISITNTTIDNSAGNGLTVTNSQAGANYAISNLDIGAAGGAAGNGVELQSSGGTYTFDANSQIANSGGSGFVVDGGNTASPNVTFSGTVTNNAGNSIAITNTTAGGTITFDSAATNAIADAGNGIVLDNVAGNVNVTANTTLTGTQGINVSGGSGTFSFSDTAINNTAGTGLAINGGTSTVNFLGTSSITQALNNATGISVTGGHTGALNVAATTNVNLQNGDGLQFNNADGNYNFLGTASLNGGAAGIDIVGGSDGLFTFSAATSVINPTGGAFNVDGGGISSPNVTYSGTIANNSGNAIRIANTTAGGTITFDSAAVNAITDNGGSGVAIDNVAGNVNLNTTYTSTNSTAQGLLIQNSSGTVSVSNATVNNSAGPGVEVANNTGTVNLSNLNVTTNATPGVTITNSAAVNVTGATNDINTTGSMALNIDNSRVNGTFRDITSTNSNGSGVRVSGALAGTAVSVTGTTAVNTPAAGSSAILIENSAGAFDFANINIDNVTGLANAVTLNNVAGSVTFSDGTIDQVEGDGINAVDVDTLVINSLQINTIGDFTSPEPAFVSDAIDVTSTGAANRTVTVTNTQTTNITGRGVAINAQGAGTLTANVSDNNIASNGDAIQTNDAGSANSLRIAVDRNTLDGFSGVRMTGAGLGSTVVTSLDSNTVTRSIDTAMSFNQITFDQATGGNTVIGSIGNRVASHGIALNNTTGELSFASLNVFNNFGTALNADTSGLGTMFTLNIADGNLNTNFGSPVQLNGVTTNTTLSSITVVNFSFGDAIRLENVSGDFTSLGASLATSFADGIHIIEGATPINASFQNTAIGASTGFDANVEFFGGGGMMFDGPATTNFNSPNGSTFFFDLQ